MRTSPLLALLLALALVVLPGCQMNERLSGTAIGGVAGGAIGAAAGGVGGAFIGAAGGAAVGYLIGDYVADQRERGRSSVFGDAGPSAPQGYDAQYAQAPTQPTQYPSMVAGVKISAAHEAFQRGRKARTAAEARRHYAESLRLDPTQPAVHNALGLHDLLDGNRTLAEQRFRTALRYDNTNYAARHNLRRMGVAGF